MGKFYSHLEHKERTLIYWWLKDKISIREMARRLRRSHSTISREIKRNLWFSNPDYFPRGAQKLYQWRLAARAKRYRLKSPAIRKYVTEKLKSGWSPELISGRMRYLQSSNYVCPESIYQFIDKKEPELYVFLARAHKKRKTKRPYRAKQSRIAGRVSIKDRPNSVNLRQNFGHWESDSVVSSCRKAALNVLVERKSRLTHITLLTSKTAKQNHQAIVKRLKKHNNEAVTSITYDNGSENTLHKETNHRLQTQSYFCEPYHSWEKRQCRTSKWSHTSLHSQRHRFFRNFT